MTQEELKRLAKIHPDYSPHKPFDDMVFESRVSSLLAPWTAVPDADGEWLLCRTIKYPSMDPGLEDEQMEYYSVNYPGTIDDIEGATRFASPLHAAEALHGEKQP